MTLKERKKESWIRLLLLTVTDLSTTCVVVFFTLTMKITTTQVVKASVTVNNNSPIQDYIHLDDHTQPTFEMTPGFKPFTVLLSLASSLSFIQCLHNVTYMFALALWNLLLQDFLWRIIFMSLSLRHSIVSGIRHFFIVQTISRNWTYIKLRRFICCRYGNIFSGSDCVWLSTHRTVWSFRSNSHTFI